MKDLPLEVSHSKPFLEEEVTIKAFTHQMHFFRVNNSHKEVFFKLLIGHESFHTECKYPNIPTFYFLD